MISMLWFYLLVSLVGWVSFPLAFRFLPNLTDRGFSLARPLGLLVWGYIFWLFASLGIAQNDLGGLFLAFALLALISGVLLWKENFKQIVDWLRQHWRYVLVGEVLFLLAFTFLCLLRMTDPAISGTEKPMELAFINAILRSPTFPPRDPWLSGYAISYYYFGYVLVAMLAKVTATTGGVAFNLGLALSFALAALGAYGLVYNLLSNSRRSISLPLLGPLFLLIVSNLEGFLEFLHAGGVFWQRSAGGSLVSGFWKWLDLPEIINPPYEPFTWIPNRAGGIWWWRASRVIQDYNLSGNWKEVIDEFPFFSYYLGDLHPHVLNIAFVLLALGLALNFFLNKKETGFNLFGLHIPFSRWEFALNALVLGGLSFLNTLDFPIYVALFAGIYTFKRAGVSGWHWRRLGDFLIFGIALGLSGMILFLPFQIGFASQVKGILPSMSFYTRGAHFWIMFAPLLLPILAYLVFLWKNYKWAGINFLRSLFLALGLVAAIWVLSFLWGGMIANLGAIGGLLADLSGESGSLVDVGIRLNELGSLFLSPMVQGASSAADLLSGSFLRRIASPATLLSLVLLLALTWGILKSYSTRQVGDKAVQENQAATPPRQVFIVDKVVEEKHISVTPEQIFIVLLILLGGLLVLVPEFFYIYDQFGTRMNTIFKFYYQAWVVWSLAAAGGSIFLFLHLKGVWKPIFIGGLSVLTALALFYPFFGLRERFTNFPLENLTLDGTDSYQRYAPDDWAAVVYLQSAPDGVIAESIGGQYSGFARFATYSGLPNVLGWPGHESQWRGGAREIGSREDDIRLLYQTSDWKQAETVIKQYDIRYVVVGTLERSAYHVSEGKFMRFLKPVFQQNEVVIYEVPPLEIMKGIDNGTQAVN